MKTEDLLTEEDPIEVRKRLLAKIDALESYIVALHTIMITEGVMPSRKANTDLQSLASKLVRPQREKEGETSFHEISSQELRELIHRVDLNVLARQ